MKIRSLINGVIQYRKSILFSIIIGIIAVAGVFFINKMNPIRYELFDSDSISYEKAKVVSVNAERVEDSSDTPGRNIGLQNITVLITSGDHKGEEIILNNYLSSTHSVYVKEGSRIVIKCDRPEGVEPYYSVYQFDRTSGIAAVFIIFIAILFIIGKTKGLRAAVALIFSVSVIAFALIPLIYNGASAILSSLVVCVVITAVTLFLLNGFSHKTITALFATVIGLAISVTVYYMISAVLNVSGYAIEETDELIMISRHTGLRISEILFSGMIIASLGAAMDTTMSISSSLFEVKSVSEKITRRELFKTGMNIGGDMIGTMCQTLILAFTGSSVASLLVAVSYGTKLEQFISSDFLAVEIFRSLTGSLAVILSVPITAWLCSVLYTKKSVK